MDNSVKAYPAPWNLQGKGYIFIYKFNKNFVDQYGTVPEFLKGSFAGGFGSVMLVDYEKSDAGPYGELLFIPGKFRFGGKKLDTISKIYVSTMESVVNGRANWGIPKEKADFSFENIGENTEKATVSVDGKTAAEFTLKSGKFSFPVSTKLLPFPLVEQYKSKHYFTNFFGKGKGHFAKIKNIKINPDLFPDVSVCRPIAVIRVDPFDITFPEAKTQDIR
ncbi:MAG: acetoacetate decarboxylase family protein [Clostridiales bacterium]|nr:acetoacetate decarboxylase family protein [Candidatus Cacconaster stercorequi]